ncbi:MAG: uncharacterized protein A8A55_0481 [Amphiamblys sp. WSBS2006]|nr:MAG: uncharacterized protein A8A55_0481 [Amphiamblys sp. WSBS2006]
MNPLQITIAVFSVLFLLSSLVISVWMVRRHRKAKTAPEVFFPEKYYRLRQTLEEKAELQLKRKPHTLRRKEVLVKKTLNQKDMLRLVYAVKEYFLALEEDVDYVVGEIEKKISSMDPDRRRKYLAKLKQSTPVDDFLATMKEFFLYVLTRPSKVPKEECLTGEIRTVSDILTTKIKPRLLFLDKSTEIQNRQLQIDDQAGRWSHVNSLLIALANIGKLEEALKSETRRTPIRKNGFLEYFVDFVLQNSEYRQKQAMGVRSKMVFDIEMIHMHIEETLCECIPQDSIGVFFLATMERIKEQAPAASGLFRQLLATGDETFLAAIPKINLLKKKTLDVQKITDVLLTDTTALLEHPPQILAIEIAPENFAEDKRKKTKIKQADGLNIKTRHCEKTKYSLCSIVASLPGGGGFTPCLQIDGVWSMQRGTLSVEDGVITIEGIPRLLFYVIE